ncbi:MAG: hypothetical protein IRZ00_04285 [Gemmatimonadetes bacterium]|nr:hypothetical protein [Gemmatimonadota bacterium]
MFAPIQSLRFRRPHGAAAGRRLWRRLAPIGLLALCACATAAPIPERPGLYVLDPLLLERIDTIAALSPSFRAAVAELARAPFPVAIGNEEQLGHRVYPWLQRQDTSWGGANWSEAAGVDEPIRRALIVIRRRFIERRYGPPAGGPRRLLEVIDFTLIHEIYGHVLPILEHGSQRGACPDAPRPGEREACVETRERRIAEEIERALHVLGAPARIGTSGPGGPAAWREVDLQRGGAERPGSGRR